MFNFYLILYWFNFSYASSFTPFLLSYDERIDPYGLFRFLRYKLSFFIVLLILFRFLLMHFCNHFRGSGFKSCNLIGISWLVLLLKDSCAGETALQTIGLFHDPRRALTCPYCRLWSFVSGFWKFSQHFLLYSLIIKGMAMTSYELNSFLQ